MKMTTKSHASKMSVLIKNQYYSAQKNIMNLKTEKPNIQLVNLQQSIFDSFIIIITFCRSVGVRSFNWLDYGRTRTVLTACILNFCTFIKLKKQIVLKLQNESHKNIKYRLKSFKSKNSNYI